MRTRPIRRSGIGLSTNIRADKADRRAILGAAGGHRASRTEHWDRCKTNEGEHIMKTCRIGVLTACALAAGALLAGQALAKSKTLDAIKERGALLCTGHNGSYLGFAEVDDKGNWTGFDIDLCRALATAVLGAPDKLKIVPLSFAQRFPSIQSGDVDVIIKVTGWTMSRDTELGLQFSRPYLLGATQLMVHKSLGVKTASELNGATVCVAGGTSTERLAASYLTSIKVKYELVTYEKSEELRGAYFSKRCDAYAGWGPNLAVTRATGSKDPTEHVILPDVLAMEPESAGMRQGDDGWVDIVNWVFSALLDAELNGVTAANVEQMKSNPPNPTVARLLGQTPGIGQRLDLRDTWAYDMIKAMGNYGEIFDRTLGKGSKYKLDRGVNALYKDGGVLYPLLLD
jgi:general L-amino acid transport system substrate-binding protein